MVTSILSSLPSMNSTFQYLGGGTVAAASLYWLYNRCRSGNGTPVSEEDEEPVDFDLTPSADKTDELATEILADDPPDVEVPLHEEHEIEEIDTDLPELTGIRKIAYNLLLLAPKLFFSGLGWVIGNALMPIIGAGLGDAIGLVIGCGVSLIFELIVMAARNDPKLQNREKMQELIFLRLKQAFILAMGGLFAGTAWQPLFDGSYLITIPELRAICTGFSAAVAFTVGECLGRMAFLNDKKLGPSIENFKTDFLTGLSIAFPAETFFAFTALPLFGAGTFVSTAPAMGATTVVIGGTAGKCMDQLRQAAADKLFEDTMSHRTIDLLREESEE